MNAEIAIVNGAKRRWRVHLSVSEASFRLFLSVIVAAASDVLVGDGGGALCVHRLRRRGQPV